MNPNLGAAVHFCNTHGGHDMRSGAVWESGQDQVGKYVCVRCGRELAAIDGDVSGPALYADCDRVRWRKVSVTQALEALEEGMTMRTTNGVLYTVFPLLGLCEEEETRTSLPLHQVPLPAWVLDRPRA